MSRQDQDPQEAGLALQQVSVQSTNLTGICPSIPVCTESLYRTVDGTCNNKQNPTWGAANAPELRLLPARYADGESTVIATLRLLPARYADGQSTVCHVENITTF